MKKALITLTPNNPAQSRSSHQAGWVDAWLELSGAEVLTDFDAETLNSYDKVAIYNLSLIHI